MENGSVELVHEVPELGYEVPTLAEVGDFALLTRGGWDIGNDNSWLTIWF
ncbi:MAG: hypothetical protein JWP46_1755 [Modestobacter sp.]|jgi:hypothetical protein|nr:hypothetical protein [Modestobacter sp.]